MVSTRAGRRRESESESDTESISAARPRASIGKEVENVPATPKSTRKTRASIGKEVENVPATPKSTRKTRSSIGKEVEPAPATPNSTRKTRAKKEKEEETEHATAPKSIRKTRLEKIEETEDAVPSKNEKEIEKQDNKKQSDTKEANNEEVIKIKCKKNKVAKKEDKENGEDAKEDDDKDELQEDKKVDKTDNDVEMKEVENKATEKEDLKNDDKNAKEDQNEELKKDDDNNQDESKEDKKGDDIDNDAEMKEVEDNETTEKETISTMTSSEDNDKEVKTTKDITDRSYNKVVVHNVLKFNRKKNELEEDIAQWLSYAVPKDSIKIYSYKKPPTDSFVKVTLEHIDMVEPFLNIFKEHELKNRKGFKIYAARPNNNYDSSKNKRSRDDDNENDDPNKRMKNEIIDVRDVTIPLHKMTYQEQLDHKQKVIIKDCAVRIVRDLNKSFRTRQKSKKHDKNVKLYPTFKWLQGKNAIVVSEIIASPEQYHYRNKMEYTFGNHYEEGEGDQKKIPTVGFNVRGWSGGVCKPTIKNAPHIPKEGCDIANIFHTFLQDTTLPVYDCKTHVGVWRNVTIRLSKTMKQCMIVVLYGPPEKKDEDTLEKEKLRLVAMLTKNKKTKPKGFKVTSIYYQEYDGVSNPSPNDVVDDTLKHYYGDTKFQEKLKSCIYTISPFGSFFQVNTKGAEVLYDLVTKYCKEVINDDGTDDDETMKDVDTKDTNEENSAKEIESSDTEIESSDTASTNEDANDDMKKETNDKKKKVILLDVCCGTGTIGLTCLKEKVVDYVVGIDISQPAIRDAIINAKNNGFHVVTDDSDLCDDDDGVPKVKFIASKAEDVIDSEIKSIYNLYDEEDVHIVAVVDPARDGLHSRVLRTLRNTSSIQRIIYVSCNPTGSLINDAKILCSVPTNKYVGIPFRPIVAQPVDMFPWTNHCELVMVLDRNKEFDENDYN